MLLGLMLLLRVVDGCVFGRNTENQIVLTCRGGITLTSSYTDATPRTIFSSEDWIQDCMKRSGVDSERAW